MPGGPPTFTYSLPFQGQVTKDVEVPVADDGNFTLFFSSSFGSTASLTVTAYAWRTWETADEQALEAIDDEDFNSQPPPNGFPLSWLGCLPPRSGFTDGSPRRSWRFGAPSTRAACGPHWRTLTPKPVRRCRGRSLRTGSG